MEESIESKTAKLHAHGSWAREVNWRSEESYKRYQEVNNLIPKRPLKPPHKERDVNRWRCELTRGEFKKLRHKMTQKAQKQAKLGKTCQTFGNVSSATACVS